MWKSLLKVLKKRVGSVENQTLKAYRDVLIASECTVLRGFSCLMHFYCDFLIHKIGFIMTFW